MGKLSVGGARIANGTCSRKRRVQIKACGASCRVGVGEAIGVSVCQWAERWDPFKCRRWRWRVEAAERVWEGRGHVRQGGKDPEELRSTGTGDGVAGTQRFGTSMNETGE